MSTKRHARLASGEISTRGSIFRAIASSQIEPEDKKALDHEESSRERKKTPTMAKFIHLASGLTSVDRRREVMGWSREQAFLLISVTAVFGLWTAFSYDWWAAIGCIGMAAVFANRARPRAVRLVVLMILPNNLMWSGFLWLRGYADSVPWVHMVQLVAWRSETWLFGGQTPTVMLQNAFFDATRLRPWDYVLALIHVSFFYVPTIVLLWLYWVNPRRYWRTMMALGTFLCLGLVSFILLPSAPPWMNSGSKASDHVSVRRVNYLVAEHLHLSAFGDGEQVLGEANALAAMPSVHLGVTYLVLLVAWGGRRRWVAVAVLYLVLMAIALVYLGEHLVVDEVLAVALCSIAWWWSPYGLRWVGRRAGLPSTAAFARLIAEMDRRRPSLLVPRETPR